jgi:hypothetical protein
MPKSCAALSGTFSRYSLPCKKLARDQSSMVAGLSPDRGRRHSRAAWRRASWNVDSAGKGARTRLDSARVRQQRGPGRRGGVLQRPAAASCGRGQGIWPHYGVPSATESRKTANSAASSGAAGPGQVRGVLDEALNSWWGVAADFRAWWRVGCGHLSSSESTLMPHDRWRSWRGRKRSAAIGVPGSPREGPRCARIGSGCICGPLVVGERRETPFHSMRIASALATAGVTSGPARDRKKKAVSLGRTSRWGRSARAATQISPRGCGWSRCRHPGGTDASQVLVQRNRPAAQRFGSCIPATRRSRRIAIRRVCRGYGRVAAPASGGSRTALRLRFFFAGPTERRSSRVNVRC